MKIGVSMIAVTGVLALVGLAQASVAVAAGASLLQEDFETAHGQVPPSGWNVESSESASGMRPDWQGWSFHTVDDAVAEWGAGGKHGDFSRSSGTVAIVQSDGNRPSNEDLAVRFSSTLWTPEVPLSEHLGAVRVAFDTQYRKGQAPQIAKLVASYDGGLPVDVMQFDQDRYNDNVDIVTPVPADAGQVRFGWSYLNSANNWYWMIDNVEIAESTPPPVVPKFRSEAKPVAAPGQTLTLEVGGFRSGMTPTVSWRGKVVDGIPAADTDGIVRFSVTVPTSAQRGFMTVQISGEGISPVSQTVTVLPNVIGQYQSLEPRIWVSTLDDFDEWERSANNGPGWEQLTVSKIVEEYGTDIRQSFTRADGALAHVEAASGKTATLTTPSVDVAGFSDDLELRLDAHLRVRGTSQQSATITAMFDSGERVELWQGRTDLYSAQLRLPVIVPAEAKQVSFAIEYISGEGAGSFSVDNVYLTEPLQRLQADKADAVVDVFSDVQGALSAMCDKVMPGFEKVEPKSKVLVVNGDLVNQGTVANWDKYIGALNGCGRERYDTNVSVIGNHEYFAGGSISIEEYRERYLDYTGMRGVGGQGGIWGELLVDEELPLLWIGTEGYDYNQHTGSGPFMTMSDEQFSWLSERLEHYRVLNEPVLLFSHFVFPYSVSGTYIDFNARDYGDDASRVNALLQQNPNVVMVTSHTHWDMGLNDWTAEKRFDATSDYGINVFNSGAVTTQYGPSGDWKETAIGGADPTGLRVSLYSDRVRVTGYRFSAEGPQVIQELDVARPAATPNPPTDKDATLDLDSASVAPGEKIEAKGANWGSGEEIRFTLENAPASSVRSVDVGTLTADDKGTFGGLVTIPVATAEGDHIVVAEGQSSGLTAYAKLRVISEPHHENASLTLGANSGKAGSRIRIAGTDWPAEHAVHVRMVSHEASALGKIVDVGSYSTDAAGSFADVFVVPDVPAGKYLIATNSEGVEAPPSSLFEVLASEPVNPVVPTMPGVPQDLASTGSTPTSVLFVAILLMLGVGTCLMRRI